jgi:type I restriction enzyme, S subunit
MKQQIENQGNQANPKNQGLDNIPKLRFPEFKSEWENKKLGEVADVSSGGTPSRINPFYWNGNIPWISTTLIDFNFIEKADEYITDEGLKNSSAKLFPKGTLLMAMYGQGKTRGKIAILNIEATTNQACGAITTNNKILNPLFAFQNISKRYDEIRDLSNQGGQENLSGSIIKGIEISFPILPEQTKIAEFFTAIDQKIQTLKTKKQLLQQYKKGVMQQLFSSEAGLGGLKDEQDFDETNPTILQSSKSRFRQEDGKAFPKWEMKKLGEIAKITTGKLDANAMVENGEFRFYTCARDFYKIDKFAFDTEALLISGNGANVGYIHYYKGKFNAYQRTYVLDGFKENIIFIKYFLDKNLYERINLEKKEGNTPYIVLSTLFEMEISIPSLPEQTKIANFLSSIDEKINRTEIQIQQTQTWKKGLLQKMFV